MIKTIFVVSLGFVAGLWVPWPGIIKSNNWKCAKEVLLRSQDQGVDIRAVMAVNPKYIYKRKSHDKLSKLRLIGDACFR